MGQGAVATDRATWLLALPLRCCWAPGRGLSGWARPGSGLPGVTGLLLSPDLGHRSNATVVGDPRCSGGLPAKGLSPPLSALHRFPLLGTAGRLAYLDVAGPWPWQRCCLFSGAAAPGAAGLGRGACGARAPAGAECAGGAGGQQLAAT